MLEFPFLVGEMATMVDWNERLAGAVRAGDIRRVKEALAHGARVASPSSSDGVNGTLVHIGAAGAGGEVVRALLASAGAGRLLERRDAEGRTPLICAVQAGNADAAQALLDAGADVNARDSYGNTALRAAAAEGTAEMVILLLAAGADPLIPGRMTLNALDRARQRRTPEGRTITVRLERWIAEKVVQGSVVRDQGSRVRQHAARPAQMPRASKKRRKR